MAIKTISSHILYSLHTLKNTAKVPTVTPTLSPEAEHPIRGIKAALITPEMNA